METKPRKKPNSKRGGFTLTEIVASIMLLTIGVLAASSTLVAVMKSREYSKALASATNLAQESMEEFKSQAYGSVVSRTEAIGTISGHEDCGRVTTVTANADDTLKTVNVEVTCDKGQRIKVTTLISRR